MPEIARVGDRTTTGGIIISGDDRHQVMGKAVACLGDKATCPACGQMGTIVEAAPHMRVFGKPVALHGHKIACGCPSGSQILASQSSSHVK
jgi:uncharacterized Zn-binding protein involved in type VI secretion